MSLSDSESDCFEAIVIFVVSEPNENEMVTVLCVWCQEVDC